MGIGVLVVDVQASFAVRFENVLCRAA